MLKQSYNIKLKIKTAVISLQKNYDHIHIFCCFLSYREKWLQLNLRKNTLGC